MCQEAKKDAVTSLDAKTKAKVDVFFKKIQKKYASYDRTTAQNKFGKLLLQIESLESRLKGKNLAILLYLKSLVEKEIITISTNEFYELESIFSE